MGSSVETEVSTVLFAVPTRSPTCARAMPAMPSTGDVTLQKFRFNCACSTFALSASTLAAFDSLSCILLVCSFSEITFLSKSSWLRCGLRLRRELHRLSLPELTLRLGKCGLKWPGVDLEEDVALFHERTFLVIALEQVAGYACSNLGVLRTIESADPFAINRHVARRRVLHEHVWRRQGFDCFLLFARREDEDAYRDRSEAKGKVMSLSHSYGRKVRL